MAIKSRFRLRCVGMLKFISWYSMGAPNVGLAKGLSKAMRVLRDVSAITRLFDY